MLNNVLPWIRADWTHALVALGAVLFAIATVWGAIKAAYLKTVGHPMPRTRLTLTLDVIAELATNALGAINKVLSARGSTPLFPPTAPLPPADSGAPLVGRPGGSPGRASLGMLLALAVSGPVVLLLMAAALPGCPSVIHEPAVAPPPGSCVRGATACHLGTPFRCGPDGWSQADRRCGGLGTDAAQVVCCTTPSALRLGATVAACVPPSACVGEVSP